VTQRGGNERTVDAAALQELAAGVVHGVYRTVKACQFHADVSNDAVTSLTGAATAAIADYCAGAGSEAVALAFLGDAVFVNRQILKGSRDTHALAIELRDILETCEVTELTLARSIDRSAISSFSKLLADVQRDKSLVPRITAGEIPGVTAGKARFAATGSAREESPGQRAARTYATSVLTVQAVLAEVRAGKFELPRRVKRVAQQVVARADEDARLLVALAATGGVSLDAATIAVGSAILAVAMTRQLTTDRAVLANAAMTALLYDAGRVVLGGTTGGPQRILNDDELDRVPTRTVLALTALGRMHAPARARTALLYEVWSMRRAHRLGAVYKGRRPPTLLARIIGVARAFAELRAAGAGGGLSIDDALQMLGTRAVDGTERALVKLLIGALGIYPAGTMVTLNTGELGVVMGTPSMPLDYVRPPVKILYDADAVLLEQPIDVDLAAPQPGQPDRFIAKSIDADEQQMKAMRSYVTAATAAKRRGALEPADEAVPRSSPAVPRGHGDLPPAQRVAAAASRVQPGPGQHRPVAEATLQSAIGDADELAARITRPPIMIDESMPTHRPPPLKSGPSGSLPAHVPGPAVSILEAQPHEPTPRSAHQVAAAPAAPAPAPAPAPAAPAPAAAPAQRRRDPRNDSAPPSSMMDEIHRPVRAARAARLPAVAPAPAAAAPAVSPVRSRAVNEAAPDSATVRPPPSSHGGRALLDEPPEAHTDSTRQVSWESLESLMKPAPAPVPPPASAPREAPVHERNTSPPPPSTRSPKQLDAEATAPQSSRDELLAAFLADAPIDASIPLPGATAPPPASAEIATSPPPASADTAPPPASVETALPKGGPKRAEKVTVKRDK
jgi:hypothetical protein